MKWEVDEPGFSPFNTTITLYLMTTILTIMVLAVVVVHDALIAERLGFLALLAGAHGVQSHGATVVHASLLASRLRLDLL